MINTESNENVDTIDTIEEIGEIGEGSFSNVYLVKKSVRYYALKNVKSYTNKFFDCIAEMYVLFKLSKNDSIISGECLYCLNSGISFLLPFCEESSLDKYKFVSLLDKYHCIDSLVKGIRHLHSNNILHLDLKPANILIKSSDNERKFVICDFSLSVKVKNDCIYSNRKFISSCYRPYINLKGSSLYNRKSDLWSVGIIINEIVNNIYFEDNFINNSNIESSIISHIEREISLSRWPPKQPYSDFLKIDKVSDLSNLDLNDNFGLTDKTNSIFSDFGLIDIEISILNNLHIKYINEINTLYMTLVNRITKMSNIEGYIFSTLVILSHYGYINVCSSLINQEFNKKLKSYTCNMTSILVDIGYI